MKFLILMSIPLMLATLVPARKYSSQHDKLDIERLMKSPRYMKTSVDCYLDRGECDKTMGVLKKAIPEIILLACEKCTPRQKYILKRYLEELRRNLSQEYIAFRQKYDPNGIYFDILEMSISEASL